MEHFEAAIDRVIGGLEKKNKVGVRVRARACLVACLRACVGA